MGPRSDSNYDMFGRGHDCEGNPIDDNCCDQDRNDHDASATTPDEMTGPGLERTDEQPKTGQITTNQSPLAAAVGNPISELNTAAEQSQDSTRQTILSMYLANGGDPAKFEENLPLLLTVQQLVKKQ